MMTQANYAPGKSGRFSALVKSGETRQDSKDARSFPLTAPSCALLFPPYKFTAGFNPLFLSLGALSLSFPVPALRLLRWFAPSWAICTNSPFSPTITSVQVTVLLNPTLTDT